MTTMAIDKRLNLVLEIERTDGTTVYVHSTPISRLVYQANYSLIHKTMSTLYSDEFSPVSGSRIAYLRMKEIADAEPTRYKFEPLMQEIIRQTVVLQPGSNGWEQVAFSEVANGDKGISEEDQDEVKNNLCFFTSASWFHNQGEREEWYVVMKRLGVQITSLPPMAYIASLQTSKQSDNTGAKATP